MKKLIPVLAFIEKTFIASALTCCGAAWLWMLLLSWPISALAEYAIPSTNRVDWYPAGMDIVGGIPTTFTSTNTLSSSGLNVSVINNAISNAASNTVVQLPAGAYDISGNINMKNGVVLRGAKAVGEYGTSWLPSAAASATTLNMNGGSVVFDGGSKDTSWTPAAPNGYTITAGYTKGSTSITVSSGSFSIGDYICIYQDKDTAWVNDFNAGSVAHWLGEDYSTGDTHCFAQYRKISGVSGSVLTLDRAISLVTPNGTGLNPRVRKQSFGIARAGLENLRLKGNGSNWRIVVIDFTRESWLKGVETYGVDDQQNGPQVWIQFCYGMEFRRCFPHYGSSHSSGRNYGFEFYNWNSRHKVEDNILMELRHSIAFEGGGTDCAILYNYTDDNWESESGLNRQTDFLSEDQMPNHGAHPFMNLWEGNFGTSIWADYTQGSSSHNTLFRNYWRGKQTSYNLSNPWSWSVMEIENYNRYYNVLGNILGNPSMTSGTVINNNSGGSLPNMFKFGTTGAGGGYNDPQSRSTTILHGNYDFITDGILTWDGGSDHTFPISLYYTNGAKPSWFGDRPWPPVDTANTSWAALDRTNLPAGHIFVFGTNGVSGSTDTTNPTITITSPTSAATYDNAASLSVNLGGTASDAGGISAITYSNSLNGVNGTASGSTTWTINALPLAIGTNTITVTARDTSNNTSNDVIAVTVTNGPSPLITVLYATNYFGEIPISTTTNKTFTVTNSGTGTLVGTAAALSPWSISGNANYSLTTGNSTNITVVFTPGTVMGYYSNVVTFTGGGGTNAPSTARAYPVPSSYSNMLAVDFLVEQPLTINAGGNYISQSVEVSGAPELGGRAVVGFTLTSTTNLSLSALVTAQTSGSDSFYIALDQEPTDPANICDIIPVTSTAFAYRTVAQRGNGSAASPNWTNYVWTNVVAGTHKIVIRGREADCLLQAITVNPISTAGSADLTPPSLTITNPTSGATYTASASPLTIGGTAADAGGLSLVTFESDRGASGNATGTTNWTGSLTLQTGANVLTVTAYDTANNLTNKTLTIYYGATNVYTNVIFPPFGIRPLQ